MLIKRIRFLVHLAANDQELAASTSSPIRPKRIPNLLLSRPDFVYTTYSFGLNVSFAVRGWVTKCVKILRRIHEQNLAHMPGPAMCRTYTYTERYLSIYYIHTETDTSTDTATTTDTDSVVVAQIQIAQYEYVSHNLGISTT